MTDEPITTATNDHAIDAVRPTDGHERPLLVGVYVGGSKIAVLVVDRDARVLARQVTPTEARPQEEAAERTARTLVR